MEENTIELLKLFKNLKIDFYFYGGLALDFVMKKGRSYHKDFDIFVNFIDIDKIKKLIVRKYKLIRIKRGLKIVSFNILDVDGNNLKLDIKTYKEISFNKKKILIFSSSPIIIPKTFLLKRCLNYQYKDLKIKLLPLELLYIFVLLSEKSKNKEMGFLKNFLNKNPKTKERMIYILKQNIDFYKPIIRHSREINSFVTKLKQGLDKLILK